MHDASAVTTFLFADIEGSTRLWAREPERMRLALASHDVLARAAVEGHRGTVVKMTGDGVYAAFGDPIDAVHAALQLQQALLDPMATADIPLRVRCGLHVAVVERRDDDYFGNAVNRAARIMGAAHGGQVLLSQAVALLVAERLPSGVALYELGTVHLRDLAGTERIYQLTHPGLRRDFPAVRSLEATPNNLPQQVTSFIGREDELAEVKASLAKSRLLTLVGAGGLGKTRLSLQVGADVLDDFPDGVWFVELAPLADARLVPQAVASVLGVKEEAGHGIAEALLKHVEDRQLLLLLDNCEHLASACAALVKELLRVGPQLKVLASGREPLQVAGEKTYPLSSLRLPDPQQRATVATLTQSAAARLFVDRAMAAQPTFRVTEANATAIADICCRLDGIPLALELAAARTRSLSVETMAARLSDRFRLLTGGDRTALPRQQTLRACIDWSYDLLTDTERVLLRRLAVFAAGWTLAAAESVGAGGTVDASDILDLTDRLVQKSLVEFDAEDGRYRLLETVRQYAQERLDQAGEGSLTRTRHLTFYVALAQKSFWKILGPEQRAWMSRLDLERENLLAAHAWCDHAEEGGESGLRLVSAVRNYWLHAGLLELGYRVTVEALARTTAQHRNLTRCWALQAAGLLSFWLGSYGEAAQFAQESLSIARDIGETRWIGFVLILTGMVAQARGERALAREFLEEALVRSRECNDKGQFAQALHALAEFHRAQGSLDAAEPLYEEALVLQRGLGDSYESAICLLNLARVAIQRNSADRARAMLLEALAIAAEIGSMLVGQFVLDICAWLAAFLGDSARAARFYGAAEAQLKQTGYHRESVDEVPMAPLIARAREALGAAVFAAAESAGHALSYAVAMAEARVWLTDNPPAAGVDNSPQPSNVG